MIFVAVTRVKNEADIIEAFVRHHAEYFDTIIVLDDGSTDGTFEILQKLEGAGFRLVLLREPTIGKDQSRFMTRLMRMAFDEFGADWVAPLDADEFVELPASTSLADILPERLDRVVEARWSNFVWTPIDDESDEINPVLRLRLRMPPRIGLTKVLIPADIGTPHRQTVIEQGNHEVTCQGEPVPAVHYDRLNLCHFPIRTAAQYASKIAVGYLQYAAFPGREPRWGWHYDESFRRLKSGMHEFVANMEKDSRNYASPPGRSMEGEPQIAPLHYAGCALKFTTRHDSFLPNLLHHGEAMAARVVKQGRELAALEQMLAAATPEISSGSAQERLAALLALLQQQATTARGDQQIVCE